MTSTNTALNPAVAPESARAAYAAMVRMRRFEEKAGLLYALGTIATPCPLTVGQEAALVAVANALRPGDTLVADPATPAVALACGETCAALFQSLAPDPAASASPLAPVFVVDGGGRRQIMTWPETRASLANGTGPTLLLSDLDAALDPARAGHREYPAALHIVLTPRDARPASVSWPGAAEVREVDGGNLGNVTEALAAARSARDANGRAPILWILTPPYVGHARSAAAKPQPRQEVPDPVRSLRTHLIAAGVCDEGSLTSLENGIRDEVAAAARLLTAHCPD